MLTGILLSGRLASPILAGAQKRLMKTTDID
jgi:hypothetical protein